jgi:hypothetical protein
MANDFVINSAEIDALNDYKIPTIDRLSAIHTKLSHYSESSPRRPHTINCDDFKTVYVISDIHADFRKFIQTMQNNGFIHIDLDPFAGNDVYNSAAISNVKWIGGDNVLLLILGDLIDGSRVPEGSDVDDPKGLFEILLHILLHNMRLSARVSGSEIIFTLGNHDLCSIFGSGYSPREYHAYAVSYTHTTAKLYYQYLDPFALQNQQATTDAIRIADTRKAILQPFYKNCLYLFIRFMNGGGENVIICVHAGIHRDRTSNKYDLAPFITLQQDIDTNGPTPTNLTSLGGVDITKNDNIFFTRSIERKNRDVCDNMKETDPLVIIGHCPTHQLDDNFRDALGLDPNSPARSKASNHIYDGCDHYPSDGAKYFESVNKNDIRGCVIMGCAHNHDPTNLNLIENIHNPKYILVDTASSMAFRYPHDTATAYYASSDDPRNINRMRRVELLKLSRVESELIDPAPRHYYNKMQRQIEGVPYEFTSSVPIQMADKSQQSMLSTQDSTTTVFNTKVDYINHGGSLRKKTYKKIAHRKKRNTKRKNKKLSSRKRRNI